MQFLTSQRSISLLASFLMLAAVFSVSTVQPAQSEGELTGNIGYVSQYVFRGALENEDGAVQGGFDYSHSSGAYIGYWASTLGANAYNTTGATENDFYAGYAGEAGPVSYDIGALQYVYHNDQPAAGVTNDANEVYGSLGVGPVSAGVTVTTKDAGGWTNSGDIFATLSASETLFGDLSGSGLVRFTDLEGGGPARAGTSDPNDGLAQIEVGLSHPIGETGADMSFRYVYNDTENGGSGGDNHIVFGVNYGFGIAK